MSIFKTGKIAENIFRRPLIHNIVD